MDAYSWLSVLTMIAVALGIWKIRKRKEYKYSLLDTSGIILNLVLLVMVYPPLSLVGALLGVNRFATEPVLILLESIAIAMGRLMPAVSVAGVGASILLRRKEKSTWSFIVQFAGVAWYGITLLFGKLSGSY